MVNNIRRDKECSIGLLATASDAVEHQPGRWRIAWLLAAGVLISYLDRVNISVGQQALHRAFGLSTVAFGYLLGAYSWTYAVMQLPSGVLLDRLGLRKVGIASTFLWSVASVGTAAAGGLISLFSSRLLLGIGEAPLFPLNAKAIGYWFPETERGLPTAMFDAAAKFSPAIGIPLVGLMLLEFGWRFSFAVTGLLSFLYLILFARIYRNPSMSERASLASRPFSAGDSHSAPNYSLGQLVRNRKIVGLTIGFATYNYSFYLLLTWLPSYAATGLHLAPVHAVWAASIPWFFAGGIDIAVGGWMVDWLIRSGYHGHRVRRAVLLVGMVFGLGVAGPALTRNPVLALVALSIGLGGLAAAAPVGWSLPGILVPPGSCGRVGGIMNFGSQAAAISAPIITGYLTHWTRSFSAAFALAGVLLIFGIVSYVFLLGAIEPIDAHIDA